MISFCQPFEIHNTTRRKIQDCGDLLLCAKRRKVEIRASSQSKEEDLKMGLPLVVLLGIFDSLKVEMQQALDIDFWNTFDPFAAHGLDRFSQTTGFQEWRETLRSMALVHSSWQAHARRLLGHNIVGNRGLTRALVRSPIFGGWTRELYASFVDPISTDRPQDCLLPDLCGRIPNVRLVSFSLPEDGVQLDSLTAVIC